MKVFVTFKEKNHKHINSFAYALIDAAVACPEEGVILAEGMGRRQRMAERPLICQRYLYESCLSNVPPVLVLKLSIHTHLSIYLPVNLCVGKPGFKTMLAISQALLLDNNQHSELLLNP